MSIISKNYSILKDHLSVSHNRTPYEVQASSRIQRNGVMTKSNKLFSANTEYKIKSAFSSDNKYILSIYFEEEGKIPYGTDLEFESREDALAKGWNV
jgi:hypothetical protein